MVTRALALCIAATLAGCNADVVGADSTGEPTGETRDGGSAAAARDAGGGSADASGGGADAGGTRLHSPHPMLVDIPDNTALDLGRYDCESRLGVELGCHTITDYSRLNYDPYFHRLLMFGGGHAATGRTDVDVFDLRTLTWESLYPSMTCAEVAAGDIDPRGFHRATGHPVARHTYDMNVIAEVGGEGRLLMFSSEGFAGRCHDYNAPIRAIASLRLAPEHDTWEYGSEMESGMPWRYAVSAEYDPISGMVVIVGNRAMWVVSPATLEIVFTMPIEPRQSNHANLVFVPSDGKMYNIITGDDVAVTALTLDREDWSRSTFVPIDTTGPGPASGRQFAYDTRYDVIIGAVVDDAIHVLDPETRSWTRLAMNIVSPDGARPGSGHSTVAVDYDPINNVFFFLTKGSRRTWAYRYRR